MPKRYPTSPCRKCQIVEKSDRADELAWVTDFGAIADRNQADSGAHMPHGGSADQPSLSLPESDETPEFFDLLWRQPKSLIDELLT